MASRHGNTTIYAGNEDARIAVQPTGRGAVRILVTMNNRRAPANYDFPLTLPAGAELLPDGRGGFDIVLVPAKSPLIGIGHVAAPWASDAQGKPVATSYTLRGHTISQRIEVNAHTAYPVVADPSIGVGWYIYVKYSKSEVASVAQKSWWAGASAAAGYACGMIPAVGWGAVAKLGCAVYVAVNWYVVNGWFSEANSRGCGLEIQFNYPAGSAPPQLHGYKLKC
jgi:hypothetical protein